MFDLERLITELHNPSGQRRAAAEALGKTDDQRAVESLIQVVGDGDWRLREAAAVALGALRDRRAVEPLLRLLQDAVGDVSAAAFEALICIGDARIIPILLEAIRQPGWNRLLAIQSLGSLDDATVLPELDRLAYGERRITRASQQDVAAAQQAAERIRQRLGNAYRDE
jgi:HEAT repeat protein